MNSRLRSPSHHDPGPQGEGEMHQGSHDEGRQGTPQLFPSHLVEKWRTRWQAQQLSPFPPIQATEGLVQDYEASLLTQEGATQADSLSLAARHQGVSFAELGLETLGQALEHRLEVSLLHHRGQRNLLGLVPRLDRLGSSNRVFEGGEFASQQSCSVRARRRARRVVARRVR
jgi:hypothetical protein